MFIFVALIAGVVQDNSLVEAFSSSSSSLRRAGTTTRTSSSSSASFALARIHRTTARTLVQVAAKDDDNDTTTTITNTSSSNKAAAEKYRAQAQALRQELSQLSSAASSTSASADGGLTANDDSKDATMASTTKPSSPWNLPTLDHSNTNSEAAAAAAAAVDYRLYVDIGREEGSWMDPRWGASGRRIELTLDVRLDPTQQRVSSEIASRMVSDNWGGNRSPVHRLESAPWARLRNGFDRMKCEGGAYRIDDGGGGNSSSSVSSSSSGTARFYLDVEGKTDGDVSIPPGCLYFSLPVFNGSVRQLSTKEGIVSVRQMGWHTGWRREESRIVGVFRAVPIDKAKRMDGF